MDPTHAPPTTSSSAPPPSDFLFVTCQVGAERALKQELARSHPDWRFAYSRPGFLTFRLPSGVLVPDDFVLESVFARAAGLSLGRVQGKDPRELVAATWQLAAGRQFDRLHVWSRDFRAAGDRGYLPAPIAADAEVAQQLLAAVPEADRARLIAPTQIGDLVLDCVQLSSANTPGESPAEGISEWWIGYHRAADLNGCQPGALWPIEMPEHGVSRAYLKLEEALRWSELPLQPGDRCAEIGASPGGASQALLDRGLIVTGIDPAEIDPRVLAHPNFTHIRKRGAEVRRREFRKTRWLLADLNVAPQYTLDTVESIALHDEVNLQGLILTLKLLDWNLAEELPSYLDRIRSWGFPHIQARQMQTSRQEVCVVASTAKASSRRSRASLHGRRGR